MSVVALKPRVRSLPDGCMGDVINVVARPRRWTLEQKLALVDEVSRPSASVLAVTDQHGMSRSLLCRWRRQAREGAMLGVVCADAAATLVPVRHVKDVLPGGDAPPPMPLRRSAERAGKSAATVEVVLSNGRVLRVSEALCRWRPSSTLSRNAAPSITGYAGRRPRGPDAMRAQGRTQTLENSQELRV